jgi:hypothetical protein
MKGLALVLRLLLPGYYSQGSIPIPHELTPRESGTFLVACCKKSSSDALATSFALYTPTSAKYFCDRELSRSASLRGGLARRVVAVSETFIW